MYRPLYGTPVNAHARTCGRSGSVGLRVALDLRLLALDKTQAAVDRQTDDDSQVRHGGAHRDDDGADEVEALLGLRLRHRLIDCRNENIRHCGCCIGTATRENSFIKF